MAQQDIAQQRLWNQHLAGNALADPCEVVRWFGAVQAQDFAGAKWAIGQRTMEATDAALDRAFAAGDLLRTHVLRPTWHLVTPDDIRWLLALTAPHVHAANAYYYRKFELDAEVFTRSEHLIASDLAGGKQRTRAELAGLLDRARIDTRDGVRLGLLIMHAELEGLICSGALRRKQHTYALLAERAPQARSLARDEALAELARRYFASHGPATIADFVWWSGLPVADAKRGLDAARPHLASDELDQHIYWFAPSATDAESNISSLCLLPNFDEYFVGYADRSAALRLFAATETIPDPFVVLGNVVIVDGQLVATWKRAIKQKRIRLAIHPLAPTEATPADALAVAIQRYGRFMQLPVQME
jgi:hypothetical protein